jgi:hypothetical protein
MAKETNRSSSAARSMRFLQTRHLGEPQPSAAAPDRIYGGDPADAADADTYCKPIDTLVSGNTGVLEIGKSFSNGAAGELTAMNTKVEAHTGLISRLNEVNTTITIQTTRVIPKAFKLMPSDVGPFAPTAPNISG